MQAIEVRVWDPVIRVFHWLLAAAVLIDWATDEPRWMHLWLGYLAGALVVVRIVWGFVGPENTRFVSFVRGPRAVAHTGRQAADPLDSVLYAGARSVNISLRAVALRLSTVLWITPRPLAWR